MKKFAIAACMALLLIGGGFAYATPTSYLSVDINPSVELGVNALDRVVKVQALNEDGTAILEGLNVKGMQVDEAVSLIVDAAADQGYIEEDGSSIVSITAGTDNIKKADELTQDAEEGAREALADNEVAAEVSRAAISHARYIAAKDAGISPGKMNLYQKLWEAENGAATEEDFDAIVEFAQDEFEASNLADVPVKDIMKAINGKDAEEIDAADLDTSAEENESGKGKANAPGQQLKAGAGEAGDQAATLPNGKLKKNVQSDDEDEEEVED